MKKGPHGAAPEVHLSWILILYGILFLVCRNVLNGKTDSSHLVLAKTYNLNNISKSNYIIEIVNSFLGNL